MKARISAALATAIVLTSFIHCHNSSPDHVIPVVDPSEQVPTSRGDKDLVAFFSTFFENLADTNHFSGVVLFAREDKIFFLRAYGIADRASGRRMTTETKLNLASSSKMFTTVAIGKLVEEGRIKFDDPVGKYLNTSWVSAEHGRKILIRHLLSHTSGLGQYWDAWDRYGQPLLVLDDYKKIISDQLSFEPGTKGQYSNTGFILLGAVIEAATGQSFYNYIDDLIFRPLQMKNTGFFGIDEAVTDRAIGYYVDKKDRGVLKNNLDMRGAGKAASAGGAWSTAPDMYKFMRSVATHALLHPDTLAYLTTPNRVFGNYGYGFQLGKGWFGHSGGYPGVEAFIMYNPQTGHTLIVFSNYYDSALPLMKKFGFIYGKISGGS
jgi:CubicO group peptidase (beta-lactamase class C family)